MVQSRRGLTSPPQKNTYQEGSRKKPRRGACQHLVTASPAPGAGKKNEAALPSRPALVSAGRGIHFAGITSSSATVAQGRPRISERATSRRYLAFRGPSKKTRFRSRPLGKRPLAAGLPQCFPSRLV